MSRSRPGAKPPECPARRQERRAVTKGAARQKALAALTELLALDNVIDAAFLLDEKGGVLLSNASGRPAATPSKVLCSRG